MFSYSQMGYLKDPPNVDLLDVEYETAEMEKVSVVIQWSFTGAQFKGLRQSKVVSVRLGVFLPIYRNVYRKCISSTNF